MRGNYRIRPIDAHTWQLEDPFHTYLYVIEGTDRTLLLDTGNGFRGLPEAVSRLSKKPVTVALTHGHFDHTGGAALFGECLLHEADLPVLQEGFDRMLRIHEASFFAKLYSVALSEEEVKAFVAAPRPEDIGFFQDGDVLELGGRSLRVIETPGHTKGSVCLIDETDGYLFSGDTVCNRELLVYFDHSTAVSDVKRSMERLLAERNSFRKIWPGHHECPLEISILEDYHRAASDILENPAAGVKISLENGYKLLYTYRNIGISYTKEHIYDNGGLFKC